MWSRIEIIKLKTSIFKTINSTRLYSKDYYLELDLKRTASKREIKQAYYRLSKKYHPDINNEPNASEKFKSINEAYEILGDERKKLEYDMSIKQGYYPTGGQSQGEDFATRTYKRRTGPVYQSNRSYDFEEHFQAHYGGIKKPPHAANSTTRGHHTRKMSDEELKNYWNTKEFSSEDYQTELRNDLFFRSLIIFVILMASYLVIKKAKESESEKGRQAELKNVHQVFSKK